jgi:hypothetical protein
MNGHALNLKEFQRRYAGRKTASQEEYSSIQCESGCDMLKLTVMFPNGFDMEKVEAHDAIAVYYPNLGDETRDKISHEKETDRIKGKLRYERVERHHGKVKHQEHCLVLEITSPVPQFIYRIRWKYKKESLAPQLSELKEGLLWETRAKLIKIAQEAAHTSEAKSAYERIRARLDKFLTGVEKLYEETELDEKLYISLAVFDDRASVLRFVAANFGSIAELFDETFMPGEGCEGFCFEKGRVVFYNRKKDSIGYYIDPEELHLEGREQTSLQKEEVLIAIPWIAEGLDIPMGVVNISSTLKTSRLLRGFEKPKRNSRILIALTQALGRIIIAELTGKTLEEM